MAIIFVYNSRCAWMTLYKVLNNSGLKRNYIWRSFDLQDAIPANIRLDEDVFCLRLQKTSSRRLQDVLIKTNIFVLVICLQDVLQKRLQDIFKTSSRRFQDVYKTSSRRLEKRLQDIFKTFWRRLQDVLQRYLKDVFKAYHQVKLFA